MTESDHDATPPTLRRLKPVLVLSGSIASVFAILAASTSWNAESAQLSLQIWGIVLALSLVNYGLRALRWQWFLGHLGHRLAHLRSACIYVGGFAFTVTPGKAGEAVRGLYLRRDGVAYSNTVAALVVERVQDLIAVALLAALLLQVLPQQWLAVTATLGLAAGVIAALLALALYKAQNTEHPPSKHATLFQRLVRFSRESIQSARSLLAIGPLSYGLVLGIVAWAAEGWGLWWICQGLGFNLGVGLAMGIYGIAVIAGALTFLPGGLIGTEAAMVALLTSVGMPIIDAVAATAICRLATLWFAVVLGAASLSCLEWAEHRGRD